MVLKKVSRGKLSQQRAKELFESARDSIGIDEGKKSIFIEIEHLISNIENEERFIDILDKKMGDFLVDHGF